VLAPHHGGETAGIEMEQKNDVIVTLCINNVARHLRDVPVDGRFSDWDGDATAEIAEYEDLERWLIHHVKEHTTTGRHVALYTRTHNRLSVAIADSKHRPGDAFS